MFLKKRIIAIAAATALLLTVTGISGVVVDSLGYVVTSPAHACNTGSSGGGGC